MFVYFDTPKWACNAYHRPLWAGAACGTQPSESGLISFSSIVSWALGIRHEAVGTGEVAWVARVSVPDM